MRMVMRVCGGSDGHVNVVLWMGICTCGDTDGYGCILCGWVCVCGGMDGMAAMVWVGMRVW